MTIFTILKSKKIAHESKVFWCFVGKIYVWMKGLVGKSLFLRNWSAWWMFVYKIGTWGIVYANECGVEVKNDWRLNYFPVLNSAVARMEIELIQMSGFTFIPVSRQYRAWILVTRLAWKETTENLLEILLFFIPSSHQSNDKWQAQHKHTNKHFKELKRGKYIVKNFHISIIGIEFSYFQEGSEWRSVNKIKMKNISLLLPASSKKISGGKMETSDRCFNFHYSVINQTRHLMLACLLSHT